MGASTMNSVWVALFVLFASSFRARAALQAEILALRHQLAVLPKIIFLRDCFSASWGSQ
jgi:hypothetical protein